MLEPNIGISRVVHGVADDVGAGYPANSEFGTNTCLYRLALSRNISLDEQPDDFYYSLLNKSGRFIYRRNGSFSTIPYDPVQVSHNTSPTFSIVDEDGTTYNLWEISSIRRWQQLCRVYDDKRYAGGDGLEAHRDHLL